MAGLHDKLFILNFRQGLDTLRQRHIEAIVRSRFALVGKLSSSVSRGSLFHVIAHKALLLTEDLGHLLQLSARAWQCCIRKTLKSL